ncbi:MAG: tetratricopeptide repeat protein [Terriglobia bacterium]
MILGRAEDIHATLERAEELAKGRKGEESTRLYRQVLRSDPQCWQAYVGIGRNHFAAGEYADAAAAFQKALEFQPSDPKLLNWLGRSYLQQHHPEKISELLSRANSTITNSALAHLLLARAYDAQDKVDEAKQEIDRALTIDPRCHGAHFAHGFIDWSTGELLNAERELRQELSLDPHESLAAYYLAEVLEKQGKLTEAEGVLKEIGQEVPNTYLYELGLGKLHERKKNNPLAAEHYREAIRLDEKQPEAHYRLGVILRAQGETAEAKEEFQAFSQLAAQTTSGMGRGMGRMRPRLPDFD